MVGRYFATSVALLAFGTAATAQLAVPQSGYVIVRINLDAVANGQLVGAVNPKARAVFSRWVLPARYNPQGVRNPAVAQASWTRLARSLSLFLTSKSEIGTCTKSSSSTRRATPR